jgi:Domain of unknown function (DUF4272)
VLEIAGDPRIDRELEIRERRLFETPLGQLDERALIDGSWRAEALAVLAWALNCFELPPFDVQADAWDVTEALGMADADVPEALLSAPALRPSEEIQRLSEQLFAAHWRIREFGLRREALDFPSLAERAWFGPLQIDGLPLLERDLALRGTPITEVDSAVVQEVESILIERRGAVGWLCGDADLLSEVALDT